LVQWFNPASLQDVYTLLTTYAAVPVRLCVGSTSAGVVKYYPSCPEDNPSVFINLAQLSELNTVRVDAKAGLVTVGGNVTLSQLISALDTQPTDVKLAALAAHLRLVAHPAVRDVAGWAGNLSVARQHADFPSDLAVILTAAQASLVLSNQAGSVTLTVPQFLQTTTYVPAKGYVLTALSIPFAASNEYFASFKVMSRHANTHALVNAAFRLVVSRQSSQSVTVTACALSFGNIAVPGPLQCPATSAKLIGQVLSLPLLSAVLPTLASELVVAPPSVPDPNFVVCDPQYRQSLAEGLFYKFFLGALVSFYGQASLDPRLLSAALPYVRYTLEDTL
jgi:CO/xanthine dehydrogenase FAD-binding subunit